MNDDIDVATIAARTGVGEESVRAVLNEYQDTDASEECDPIIVADDGAEILDEPQTARSGKSVPLEEFTEPGGGR